MKRKFEVPEALYPFSSRYHSYQDGFLHYLDEGTGPVILCLHGNPTWSFLYRNIVSSLRDEFRLIVPDYPGFGFSKAPTGYGYTIKEHASALDDLLSSLELEHLILVVQDWGGPIGLSWAVENSDKVSAIVLGNSLLASPKGYLRLIAEVVGSFVGRWLITRLNLFAAGLMPSVIRNPANNTPVIRKAYKDQFPTVQSRIPTWMFPREVMKAGPFMDEIRSKMDVLSDTPTELVFGKKDPALGYERDIRFWESLLPNHNTVRLSKAGHYIQEDDPEAVVQAIRRAAHRCGV